MKRKATNTFGDSATKRPKLATPNLSTSLLDLNDDCLFEVFHHLDLVDLASVGDVCSRLKATTQYYFELPTYRNMSFPCDMSTMEQRPSLKMRLLQMYRVMRNVVSMIQSQECWNATRNWLDCTWMAAKIWTLHPECDQNCRAFKFVKELCLDHIESNTSSL